MAPVVLGIDTSSVWCSAALVRGDTVFARRLEVGHAHSTHLLAMIEDVLAEAQVELGACSAIAFGAGPGSFTGLRVACAAAQGLAFGASLPVVAVGTLEAIAASVLDSTAEEQWGDLLPMLVAQDARMDEVYWTVVDRVDGRLRAIRPYALDRPEALAARLRDVQPGERTIRFGCGNAFDMAGGLLAGLVDEVVHRDAADAVEIARLGAIACRDGLAQAPETASPAYVRNDVARTTAERAAIAAAKSTAPVASAATR